MDSVVPFTIDWFAATKAGFAAGRLVRPSTSKEAG
jgi:hypothetical protein